MEALAEILPAGIPPLAAGVAVLVVTAVVVLALLRTITKKAAAQKTVAGRSVPSSVAAGKNPKKVAKLAKKADPATAARLLQESGKLDQAFDLYVQAELFDEAAGIAIELGKKDRAASLYERSGKHRQAAELLEGIRQLEPAAKLYARAKDYRQAAELFIRLGNFEKAAENYARDEDFRAAAEVCVKQRDYAGAAKYYRKITDKIVDGVNDSSSGEKRQRFLKKAAKDAADVFERVNDYETAFILYKAAGDIDGTARIAAVLGKEGEGAEILIKEGRIDDAIDLLEQSGDLSQATRLKARQLEESGDLLEAGHLYLDSAEYAAAAELYINVGRPDLAATAMEQDEKYGDAAIYYIKAQEGKKAARCYELAGMQGHAAGLYQRLGMETKAVELFLAEGNLYQAGLTLAKMGEFDKSIDALEKSEETHVDYSRCLVLRADIHVRKKEFELAVPLYESGLANLELDKSTVQSFYRFGVLLENQQDLAGASKFYKNILKFDKNFKDVRDRYTSITARDENSIPTQSPAGDKKKSRYVILGELGRGGMGVVHKAMDRTLDRVVALKVLPDEVRENKSVIQNFFREAKSAAGLNHSNIVTVFDAGEENGMYYIAMEYIEGRTLKQVVREQGPMPLSLWLLAFRQVCSALHYAGQQKIVHRDIKPSNLMWIEKEQVVKITDFGLAKIIQEVANFQTIVGGTPHYMSPEQILGEEVDQRADIYSLGATMYELATGSVPYPKGDAGYHHINSPVPDPSMLRDGFPTQMAGILMKCMQKNQEDRYQQASDVFDALEGLGDQL